MGRQVRPSPSTLLRSPPMMSAADSTCMHERRPGTSVCLRCRRDARLITRARRRRAAAWLGGATLALGFSAMAGVSGLAAFTSWRPPAWIRPATTVVTGARLPRTVFVDTATGTKARPVTTFSAFPRETPVVEPSSTDPGPVAPVALPIAAPAAATAAPAPATAAPSAGTHHPQPPLTPIVAEGATVLRDSVVAIRAGNSVTVHFDTPGGRTRRPEKFEQIVRATLPVIYGPAIDSILARIPRGSLTASGGLLTELPRRGFRLALGTGWMLALWPGTRTGHDGPLVVAYRASVMR